MSHLQNGLAIGAVLLGMPAFAAVVAWLVAGREPAAMARQAIV
jgi:hypothetical protein